MSVKVVEQRDVDVETTQRMLMESAAMAAASAVAGIVERYHLQPQVTECLAKRISYGHFGVLFLG